MTKKMFQRFRRVGASIAVCVVALVFIVVVSACAGVNTNGNTTTVTGPVVSVNAQQHSVSLNFNGQTITINGLTDQEVALLQANASKISSISLQVTKNSDGSYTISSGQNSITISFTSGGSSTFNSEGTPEANNNETPNATEPQGQVEPGSISFTGNVKSVSSSNIVVSLPDGSTLSMTIVNGQTDLSDFNGGLPSVNQLIKVDATANTDGSFLASKLKPADSNDNTVDYKGVTTSAVGSDHVIHFKVGNKSYSFTIGSSGDLSDFNGNAQSIGNNVSVKVEVQFQGNTYTVTKVSSSNGQ